MVPFVLYSNIYTLKDRDAKTNKYIDMYLLWLTNIIKYANLQKTDMCFTYMDEETYMVIQKNDLFRFLQTQIRNFTIIKYPQPSTHKEGMLRKYIVDPILHHTRDQNPIYMYLDIDVLIVKDIRTMKMEFNENPQLTKLFLYSEMNTIEHGNYYGHLMTDKDKELLRSTNKQLPGFSAGIFAWQNNIHICEFFNTVLELAFKHHGDLYTIEQPFFNAAIFKYIMEVHQEKIVFDRMDNNSIGYNEIGAHLGSFVLVNFCGEPGDQTLHWNKMYCQLILQLLRPQPSLPQKDKI